MSTEEKNEIKGSLSDLFAKAKGLNDLDLVLIRDEIRKEIEAGDKTLEKFLELVESFKEVLPKEKQWYRVAIRALFTTSKISQQNVLESIDKQLEELGKLEDQASSVLTGFSDELSEMDFKLQKIKSELTELREKIAALEKEEHEIIGNIADRGSKKKEVEEAVKKVFADLAAEISTVKKKIEGYTAEKGSPQSIVEPDSIESHMHEEAEKGSPQPIAESDFIESYKHEEDEYRAEKEEHDAEEEVKKEERAVTQETEWVKKCPMCGGQLNFLIEDAKWMCYTCGHEEETKDEN